MVNILSSTHQKGMAAFSPVLWVMGLGLGGILIQWFVSRIHVESIALFENALRREVWQRVENLSPEVRESFSSGTWIQKLSGDVYMVADAGLSIFDSIVRLFIFIAGSILVLSFKEPILIGVFVFLVCGCIIIYLMMRRRMQVVSFKKRKSLYKLNDTLCDLLDMNALLNCLGLNHLFSPLFKKASDLATKRQIHAFRIFRYFDIIIRGEMWLAQVIILLICTFLYTQERMTVGDIIAYDLIVTQLISSLAVLMASLPHLEMGFECASSLHQTLLLPQVRKNSLCKQQNIIGGGIIKFNDVSFRYANVLGFVFKNFNAVIHFGEYVCFLGRNGAGKSTLIKLILGYYSPTCGEIICHESKRAMVPQRIVIYRDSLFENIRLRDPNIGECEVLSIIDQCNLTHFVNRLKNGIQSRINIDMLSGGELQSIGIARAIVRKPKLLIVDEITNNLDIVSKEMINDILYSLKGTCTIISVTHDISSVIYSDRIFLFGRDISEIHETLDMQHISQLLKEN